MEFDQKPHRPTTDIKVSIMREEAFEKLLEVTKGLGYENLDNVSEQSKDSNSLIDFLLEKNDDENPLDLDARSDRQS